MGTKHNKYSCYKIIPATIISLIIVLLWRFYYSRYSHLTFYNFVYFLFGHKIRQYHSLELTLCSIILYIFLFGVLVYKDKKSEIYKFLEKIFIVLTSLLVLTAIYLFFKTIVIDVDQFDYSV